jgi:hypothetical protein
MACSQQRFNLTNYCHYNRISLDTICNRLFITRDDKPIPFSFVLILPIVIVLVLALRYSHYRKFFIGGQDIAAKITRISRSSSINFWSPFNAFGNRQKIICRIEYLYTFQERTYQGKGKIKGRDSEILDCAELWEGVVIAILVDPNDPRCSIIRNLYAAHARTLRALRPESAISRNYVPGTEKEFEQTVKALV